MIWQFITPLNVAVFGFFALHVMMWQGAIKLDSRSSGSTCYMLIPGIITLVEIGCALLFLMYHPEILR